MRSIGFIGFAVVLGALALPAKSSAQSAWSSVGAGCVPTGQTIEGGLHVNSAGRTSFLDPEAGEIILTCPITMPLSVSGDAAGLTVAYRDPDGTGNTARIVASLRRMNKRTGAEDTVATFDSNTNSATEYNVAGITIGRCFTSAFDQATYHYYVQISMTRSASGIGVEIAAVAIDPVFC